MRWEQDPVCDGGCMLRGEFSPEAQKRYRTKKQERSMLLRKRFCFCLAMLSLLGLGLSLDWALLALAKTSSPKPLIPAIIATFALVASAKWFWDLWYKLKETAHIGYTVIEKANGAIHCSLQAPHDLGNGQVGYRGPNGVPQPTHEYFILAPLREDAEGQICKVNPDGVVTVNDLPTVIVHDPIGDFSFADGFNGTYRWTWDVQSCQMLKIEDMLYGYFNFYSFQSMAFLRRGVGHEYDTPWAMQAARRETARVLMVMMRFLGNSTGRIPIAPLRLFMTAAMEGINLSAGELETLKSETVLGWREIAADLGVKVSLSTPAPATPTEASA